MASGNAPFLVAVNFPRSVLPAVLHVLLYALLCLAPALILLPLRYLDREPRNAITHESGDEQEQEPDGTLTAAA